MRHPIVTLAVLAFGCLAVTAQSVWARRQDAPPLSAAVQQANDRFVNDVLRQIAGHEAEPAGQVFKNVQIYKTAAARTLLTIMSVGYAPALGVACTHCHVETDFASDSKRPKRAAREMAVMHRSINDQLAKMENLATPPTENRAVNCVVCHRGHVNPRTGG